MTRARRDQQWREQAARLIVEGHSDPTSERCGPKPAAILRGASFDVALVRAYCERLISEADDLDVERAVFADWTRARGMGPENRDRGAFVRDLEWCITLDDGPPHGPWTLVVDGRTSGSVWGTTARDVLHAWRESLLVQLKYAHVDDSRLLVFGKHVSVDGPYPVAVTCVGEAGKRGGWPGKLARAYAAEQRSRRRCPRKDCDGGVLVGEVADVAASEISARGCVMFTDDMLGDARVNCPECEAFNATRTSRAFANGGNLRRAARRLLDTLDGRCPWNTEASTQPSKCARCKGKRYHRDKTSQSRSRKCADCSGTGHNLRGVLPPLPEGTERKLAPTRPRFVSTIHDSILVDPLVDDAEPEFTEQLRRMWLDDIVPLTAARRDALAY